MKAIRVHSHGGPDVLAYEDVDIGQPGPGEVRVRNRAIGVNFVDIYLRTGAFVPAHFLVHLPDAIDFETAAAMMLKGLTAQYLLRRTFHVEAGHTILVHAAAGGVGLILTQWAKHLGATVIGTVGSPEKAELAHQNGCDDVIDYRKDDFAARVKEVTKGEGCHVVYDGVGNATFPGSLDCLRPFGYFVSFGSASGPIPPFDIMLLAGKGSLFATWPVLTMHLAKREDVLAMSHDLFEVVASGAVKIQIHARMPVTEAAEAQRRLEARQTSGATVLLPVAKEVFEKTLQLAPYKI